MTQEQKPKAYDEALEQARRFHKAFVSGYNYPAADIKASYEAIFPELKMSEDDKIVDAIRKALESKIEDLGNGVTKTACLAWLEKQIEIDKASYEISEKEKREFVGDGFIKCLADFQDFKEGETYWLEYIGNDNYNVRSDNLLGKTCHITPCQLYTIFKRMTWLEKQGENTEKDEPKFKVGDWVVTDKNNTVQIKAINTGYYSIDNGMDFNMAYVDKCWHLWTIQDAKDGDVLQLCEVTAIFKEFIGNGCCRCYCSAWNGEFEIPSQDGADNSYGCHNAIPATKEQRDLLFQKMKDTGYEWDAEKKELKEIINEKQIKKNLQDNSFRRMFEQKSAEWHREDEQNLNACLGYIPDEFLRRWLADIIHVKYDKLACGDTPLNTEHITTAENS